MPLDPNKLENLRERGGKTHAACPACREVGADTHGDNLAIFEGGAYRCIRDDGKEHSRRIFQLAGAATTSTAFTPPPLAPRQRARKPANLPSDLRTPNAAELAQIASRWPSCEGLDHLAQRRLLHVGTVQDRQHRAFSWILSDGTTAEARRMDGAWFQGINAKAYSLSQKDRPIVSIPDNAATVYICEGLPDLLACCIALKLAGHDLPSIGFICVLGSGCSLGESAQHLKDRQVVIAEDADAAGKDAADKWTAEAYNAGAAAVSSFVYADGAKDFSDHLSALAPTPEAPAPKARTPAPAGYCPACWSRNIVAPINGPTCTCRPYVWPVWTPEQIAADASIDTETQHIK